MIKTVFAGVIAVTLAASGMLTNSVVSPPVLAKLNCDSDSCSGGCSFGGGGAGGKFTIDEDGTFTQSGGGGSKFTTGGGGGRTVCDSDGNCETSGGGKP